MNIFVHLLLLCHEFDMVISILFAFTATNCGKIILKYSQNGAVGSISDPVGIGGDVGGDTGDLYRILRPGTNLQSNVIGNYD